jgi:hypothetical protein
VLAPDVESDPPPAELYAALPDSAPVILPFEMRSRQEVAPDVARLEGLAPSNSKVGEDETAAIDEDGAVSKSITAGRIATRGANRQVRTRPV